MAATRRRRRTGGGLSFDSWYADNFGAIGWKLQEPSGDVALAINKRVDLGRNVALLTIADWSLGTGWSDIGSNIAQAVNGVFLRQNGILALGKPFQITLVISNHVSGDIRLRIGTGTITAAQTGGDGVFVFNGICTGSTDLFIDGQSVLNADVDVSAILIQQTDIASDKEFSGAELYVVANAASDPAGNEADATTGWVGGAGGIVTSDGTIKNVGGFSIKGVFDGVTNGSNISFDLDTILTVDEPYMLMFNIRHLGSGDLVASHLGSAPNVSGTRLILLNNTVTTFQTVTKTFVHSADTRYLNIREISSVGNDGGAYIDNISTTEDNPINARNNGMAVAQAGQGNIPLVYSGDGGTTRLSFDTIAEINSIINMLNGGFVMVAQSDTWAAGVDVLARFAVDADNEIVIFRDGTDLKIEYRETATSSIVTIPSGSPSGMFTIGGKWNVPGFGLRGLYNGVQVDTDKAIAAVIIGNLDKDECALFAEDSGGTASWAGDGAYPALQTETPDDSFFAEYHSRSGL